MEQEELSWDDVKSSTYQIAKELVKPFSKSFVVLSPHYGGWPVATLVINNAREILSNPNYKPPVITESELTRHFLIPLLATKNIVIFDDVLDTGKVINGIIWRILHECETFISKDEILKSIIICTIGKKSNCDYECRHIYTHRWPQNLWIKYPWE